MSSRLGIVPDVVATSPSSRSIAVLTVPGRGGGECPEWVCTGCGAGVIMGTVIIGTPAAAPRHAPARQSVRAA